MQRGKRQLCALLVCGLLLCILFGGCAGRVTEPAQAEDGLKIVTTNFPLFDFARTVAGGHASVQMLLPPGAESHSYEPSPRDIIDIQDCDLVLYIGGENDAWIETILNSMGEARPETLALIDCVDTLDEAEADGMTIAGHEHEHEHGHAHEQAYEPDEHIWTSLRNAAQMTEAICATLSALDPSCAADYQANSAAYLAQLDALDAQFTDMIDAAARNSIVVGDRFPFAYFARDYGLAWYAAFPGCSAHSEPSAATVALLTDRIKTAQLPAVFYIEFSNHKVADAIAESAGVGTLLLHSCHNVTRDQLEAGESYLSLMQQNYLTLAEALN